MNEKIYEINPEGKVAGIPYENISIEFEADFSDLVIEEFDFFGDKARINSEIESFGKLPDANVIHVESAASEKKCMNLKETISHENVLPYDVLTIFKVFYGYYNRDEIQDVMKRARKEYYNLSSQILSAYKHYMISIAADFEVQSKKSCAYNLST